MTDTATATRTAAGRYTVTIGEEVVTFNAKVAYAFVVLARVEGRFGWTVFAKANTRAAEQRVALRVARNWPDDRADIITVPVS